MGQEGLHPLFVWNCLGRAGASQYHGHAQVMLSSVPFPKQDTLRRLEDIYDGPYHLDLIKAHDSIGLSRGLSNSEECAFPHVCPLKDCEIFVYGKSLDSKGFHTLVYSALRTLIDRMGTNSFNMGIFEMPLGNAGTPMGGPVIARIVSRGTSHSNSFASDYGGLEVFAGASIGHTDPFQLKFLFDDVLDTVLQSTSCN